MQNVVGLLLACLGLLGAVSVPFGIGVGVVVSGSLLFVGSLGLLIDVDGGS